MFGVKYRTTQFDAVSGLDLMELLRTVHPCEVLKKTEVEVMGNWVPLNDPDNVNFYVKDVLGIVPPLKVLIALSDTVSAFSFEFLSGWKGVKVPSRFISDAVSVSTAYSKPLITQLVQSGSASLKELEEYYSLEDAFKMFEINVAKGVNDALSSEAAAKASKR